MTASKSNSAVVEQQISDEEDTEIINTYKVLSDKCEDVLKKIKSRKNKKLKAIEK